MKNIFFSAALALVIPCISSFGQELHGGMADDTKSAVRILEGDNSDPSIVRLGDTYYMTHSSFLYTPGLVVYSSKDLVNWKPCSTALNTFTGDIWAPDITVCNGKFFIYFPTRDKEGKKTNMVTWAKNADGPWSEPVDLKIGGIDPEHVVDETGKRYLLLSSGLLYPLSDDGMSIAGDPVKICGAWQFPEEWDVEGVAMEGPNMKKIGDYYYLFVAEGGTAGPPTSHMVVQWRSKSVKGPWECFPENPLIRTLSRNEHWWSKGHGSIVDTPDGRIFMAMHGYENGFQTLGRQTLLCELQLDADGWLRLKKDGSLSLPQPERKVEKGIGDFVWQTCGEHSLSDRFNIEKKKITIMCKGESPKDASPLLARTSAHRYEIEACLELKGENASAGLVMYYNSDYHFGYGFNHNALLRYRRGQVNHSREGLIPAGTDKLWLRVRDDEHVLSAWYSLDGKKWHKYEWGFEISGVHHNTVYGFLFVRPGIYAGGDGEVVVTDFKLRELD